MLKIECVNCNSWFHLAFNTEAQVVDCPHCREKTPTKDVYVSAGPYMIFRDVLIKNMPKYRRLILEAEKEILDLQKKSALKTYNISAKSVDAFIASLREMLDGCRDSVRYRLPETVVEYTVDGNTFEGDLVNISTTGLCINGRKVAPVTRLWGAIEVALGHKEARFAAAGKIVWIGKEGLMGIKFTNLSPESSALLKLLIIEKSGLKDKVTRD